ncbi:MAG TPA: SRPBCC family protein [Gammaproteobacteria bacterium]|nr:SRPBCC family protein [Gammaproteobacteria bacterium]
MITVSGGRMNGFRAAGLVSALFAAVLLTAGTIGDAARAAVAPRPMVSVTVDSDGYHIRATAYLSATPAGVYRVLTDYEALSDLNPDLLQLHVVPARAGRSPRLRTVFRVCVLGLCRHVVQVMSLREQPPNRVSGTIVADDTDFVAGEAEWTLSRAGQGTRIEYQARFMPRFWLPPVLGPWLARRWLERDLHATLRGLRVLLRDQARAAASAP